MFGYGFLGVVLVLYLAASGLDSLAIGVILTATLLGDALISLWLTTRADRLGRRFVLVAGSILVVAGGTVFASTDIVPVLVVAGIIGVISPTGFEVGPFLAVEQASLAHIIADHRRTATFAWYQLVGAVATAFGALVAGLAADGLQRAGWSDVDAFRVVLFSYVAVGATMIMVAWMLGPSIEVSPPARSTPAGQTRLGLDRSRGVVARLAALFALDSIGGGFVPQSLIAFWLATTFATDPATIGTIFFASHLLGAGAALGAARLAARIGLVRTMVFTHLPAALALIAVPFMPTLPLAVTLLLIRAVLGPMDVPARQSYVLAVVEPDERSAAAGVTGTAKTFGAAVSPAIASLLVGSGGLAAVPFVLAGAFETVYDLLLYRGFKSLRPPEERAPSGVAATPRS
jgi:MFS family permease